MTTAERIRQLRKKNKLSQAQLASIINVQSNTVSTWERGTRKPDAVAVGKLAAVFGVPFEYIVGSGEEHTSGEARVTADELNALDLEAVADELESYTRKFCALSEQSRKIVEGTIDAAWKLEEAVEGRDEIFEVEIRVKK